MIDRAGVIEIVAGRFGLPILSFAQICERERAGRSLLPVTGVLSRSDLRAMSGTDDPTDMRALFAVRMHHAARDLAYMLTDLAARGVTIDQELAEAVAEALAPIFEVSNVRTH